MNPQWIEDLVQGRKILYLSERDVLDLGVYDFAAAAGLITHVFLLHHRNKVLMPRSEYLTYPGRSKYDRVICLLGYIGSPEECTGIKIISSSLDNGRLDLPRASGLLVLCDSSTQRPYCIMEASHVSATRTAAVTATALRYVRPSCLNVVAILGCGMLALTHLRMWTELFPETVVKFALFDLDSAKARSAAAWGRGLGLHIQVCETGEEAIRQADVIIPATTAERAWINSEWLKPGSVFVVVSLLDAELDVFRHADWIVVDDESLCRQERRPLHILDEQNELDALKVVTLGSLISGDAVLTRKAEDRTVFNPMGAVMTDLILGGSIFQRAYERGVGVRLNV